MLTLVGGDNHGGVRKQHVATRVALFKMVTGLCNGYDYNCRFHWTKRAILTMPRVHGTLWGPIRCCIVSGSMTFQGSFLIVLWANGFLMPLGCGVGKPKDWSAIPPNLGLFELWKGPTKPFFYDEIPWHEYYFDEFQVFMVAKYVQHIQCTRTINIPFHMAKPV